jgi:type 1 glutamine amidotransferase
MISQRDATATDGSSRSRRLLLVAGTPSHPSGEHEFGAGALLLAAALEHVPNLAVQVEDHHVVRDLSPGDADALVIYADGGPSHPLHDAWSHVDGLVRGGMGIGFLHYAIEAPVERGAAELARWIGGGYLEGVSCNPIWSAGFDSFPEHPITRGVGSFAVEDEWYFNISFDPPEDARIVPILATVPTMETRAGPYVWPSGPYDHIVAANGRAETVMWALEDAEGRRGFGFTGGHYHANWGEPNLRRVVLNALLWVTGVEVAEEGVASQVTADDLAANLDDPVVQ